MNKDNLSKPGVATHLDWKVAPQENIFDTAKVSSPFNSENVTVVDTSKSPLGADGLTSAEKVLGFEPEMNFDDTVNSFESADPDVNKAVAIVTDLRLKMVGKLEFTQEDKDRFSYYNDRITLSNIMNDTIARQEQERVEALALKLVEDAEALLSSSTDESELGSICAKVEEIVKKLGPGASGRLLAKLEELKQSMHARSSKTEAK